MAHFIHYHKRVVSTPKRPPKDDPLWYTVEQSPDAGFDAPRFHTTRAATGPSARIKKDDTIWLMSRLTSSKNGDCPISLDAIIQVARVEDLREDNASDVSFRYWAKPSSRWMPYFPAADTMNYLRSVTKDRRVAEKPLAEGDGPEAAKQLYQIREVADPQALFALEKRVDDAPLHFISYRLMDGTWHAFNKVRDLCDKNVALWWDRWSLPRRMVERREFLDDKRLTDQMSVSISQASVVWGIETYMYHEAGSYAQRERRQAMKEGKYRPVKPAELSF